MVNRKVTPEERLLRLIESGGKQDPSKPQPHRTRFGNAKAWVSRLFHRDPSGGRSALLRGVVPEFNLEWLNRLIIILLILVLVGIVLNANSTRLIPDSLRVPKEATGTPVTSEPAESSRTVSLRPLEDYLKEAERRSLFLPAPPPKVEKPVPDNKKTVPPPAALPDPLKILQEKAQSLKLVGISWGANPTAMIENKATKETSFVRVGDSINEVKVKAILKDRAILSYDGAEYDLF